jgi:two-component system response regulator
MNQARPTRTILLVEDNEADVLLTLRAFRKSGIANDIVVVRDGQQALDYLFGHGAYADRASFSPPAIVLLDLNLPRVPGLEVLRQIRADADLKAQPAIILTSSNEEQDLVAGYNGGPTPTSESRSNFPLSSRPRDRSASSGS